MVLAVRSRNGGAYRRLKGGALVDPEVLEGIAREAHESTGGLVPVDAFELAFLCGLELVPWRRSAGALEGDRVWYPVKTRPERQHGTVAHELGHWLLRDYRMDARDEDAARYLAGALMLPRATFVRDLDATNWDLIRLQGRHPNASAEMIVVRMTQVSRACAWIWDAGKLARVYGAPCDDGSVAALVDRVLTLEEPVAEGSVCAWPIFDGRWRRVVVVARAA